MGIKDILQRRKMRQRLEKGMGYQKPPSRIKQTYTKYKEQRGAMQPSRAERAQIIKEGRMERLRAMQRGKAKLAEQQAAQPKGLLDRPIQPQQQRQRGAPRLPMGTEDVRTYRRFDPRSGRYIIVRQHYRAGTPPIQPMQQQGQAPRSSGVFSEFERAPSNIQYAGSSRQVKKRRSPFDIFGEGDSGDGRADDFWL